MQLYIYAKSYNSWGGNPHLSLAGDFLLQNAPSFGGAINEIEITLVLPDRGPPKATLERSFEAHHQCRATLPKLTFHRAKKRVEIVIASEAMDGRDWKFTTRVSLPIFSQGCVDIIKALQLLEKRIKSSDDFDLHALLSHCAGLQAQIPTHEDDLQVVIAELRAADEKRRNAKSPWEKLAIDWDDFHPNARSTLDDPFFWECTNDFSPNGNDTGADLLEDYRDWLKKHKDGQPLSFLEKLAKRWGYDEFTNMDSEVRDEASVGLAFADIKLRGCCQSEARQLALDAINSQRRKAHEAVDWPHRDEQLQSLSRLEAKLTAVSVG